MGMGHRVLDLPAPGVPEAPGMVACFPITSRVSRLPIFPHSLNETLFGDKSAHDRRRSNQAP
jgi:hypothetical protein